MSSLNLRRMEKIRMSLLLTVLLALSGCTGGGHVYKIGVAQCSSGPWREKVNREMLAAQHLYEHDVKVCIANAFDDTAWQIRQIDSLAQSGIDLLVVAPNEAAPVAEAVARVMARGIPVVFFDRKADTDDFTAFIGGNNVDAGQTVADYALLLAKPLAVGGRRPCVLEVTATMTTSPASERHEGFRRVMQAHPELDYLCVNSDWSTEAAYQAVRQQLADGGRPDIIFCHSDFMADGAFLAVDEAGLRSQVKILGIDGMPHEGIAYIQQGRIDGSYVYPTHGERIVRLALDILTGQPYERENFMPSIIVTPENADLVARTSTELINQGEDLITIQDKLEAYLGLYDTQHKVLVASFVAIVLLVVGIVMALRAYVLTRRTIRQRQRNNEEQTLFYISPANRRLRQVFEEEQQDEPVRSQDTIFAETLNEAIRQHMHNPNLKMDDLGEAVGLGRVQLYRKVKAITGQSPVELLRQMRLQRGYTLLQTTTKTVNEIAYEVGFNTPSYFSKCFREQYGKYPTDVREETKET